MNRIGLSLTVLIAALALSSGAYSLDISSLLARTVERSQFKVVHVDEVAAMMADPHSKVAVFDANPLDVRVDEGIIPGAHLLSSSGHYDVSRELPAAKDTPLVFYCHNVY